jgi:membrane protease YdiL (CAAX protease family)
MTATAPEQAQLAGAPRSIRPVNAAQAAAFVAVWMTAGYLLPVDPNLYLLIGIPLTLAFQRIVRRRPVRDLWVRDAPAFRLDRNAWILAGVLAIAPAVVLVQVLRTGQWVLAAWMAAAVAGAIAAAWALRQARRSELATWTRWVLAITAIGMVVLGVILVPAAVAAGWPGPVGLRIAAVVEAILLYVPVQFFIEEVSFRGLLDTHVHHDGAARQWASALLVSALWGLWHLPIAPAGQPLPVSIAQVLVVHCLIGVPMSLAWRRTGNLTVPVIAHALIDAFRNALMIGL